MAVLRLEALRHLPTAFAMSYEEALQQDLAGFAAIIPARRPECAVRRVP